MKLHHLPRSAVPTCELAHVLANPSRILRVDDGIPSESDAAEMLAMDLDRKVHVFDERAAVPVERAQDRGSVNGRASWRNGDHSESVLAFPVQHQAQLVFQGSEGRQKVVSLTSRAAAHEDGVRVVRERLEDSVEITFRHVTVGIEDGDERITFGQSEAFDGVAETPGLASARLIPQNIHAGEAVKDLTRPISGVIVDGIDNNDKAVSGPQIYISPESVAEFNILTNQASAEFARSTGGQFVTVTKSGGNDFHGTAYEFFRNKELNSLDNLQKLAGVTRETNPRYDQNRFGFNIGGPLYLPRFGEGGPFTYPWSGKNRLFFFFQFEQTGLGQAASPGNVSAPTAEGLAMLQGLSGISATNLAAFRQFVPVASSNNAGTIPICAVPRDAAGTCPSSSELGVPIGNISFAAPNFQNNRNIVFNLDFNQSSKTVHHSRFIFNRQRTIDNLATFPEFFARFCDRTRM